MAGKKLYIKYKEITDGVSVEKVRYAVEKWQAEDKYMGESFITFTAKSSNPIGFRVGDYCEYRGETYMLNYVPSVIQKGNIGDSGDSFVYESVKFDSAREELDRIKMLDITPTTGDYIPEKETNYTGSAQFKLYCGETIVNGKTRPPVCTLAGKIQANLDRAYPDKGWKVLVDTESTHEEAGEQVLNTHSDEMELVFDNTTVTSALAEVKSRFDIDYAIKGRTIYIGYTFGSITGNDDEYYYFGYGRGYLSKDNQGKALFELRRTSDSNQKIVTRLRAMGSTKNMPYRYYNKRYNLSQAMFPTNLQLPDTFETPTVKASNNALRKSMYPWIRDVLGETNDAYIDKNDNCLDTIEGLREECLRWDGSNSDLKEIYPSIEEVTYKDLRGALCPDMEDKKGASSFANYLDTERVDEIFGVGEDANVGDGIKTEGNTSRQTLNDAEVKLWSDETQSSLTYTGTNYVSKERTVMSLTSQYAGEYIISNSHLYFGASYSLGRHQSESVTKSCGVAYKIKVYAKPLGSSSETVICEYLSDFKTITNREDKEYETLVANLPDSEAATPKVEKIELSSVSDIRITFSLVVSGLDYNYDQYTVSWRLGLPKTSGVETETDWTPSLIWDLKNSASTFMQNPFHVYVKDMGFDFVAQFSTSDEPRISMKTGMCVAREFKIGNNPEKVKITKDGKTYNAWKLTLGRAEDKDLNTYYPSENYPLSSGDKFVILGIEMPEVYINAASMKLLVEATKALADLCETKHEYEPKIDEIYLQRNYDRCKEEGDATKSVYWKLASGMKFPFFGVRESEDESPSTFTMIIDTLSIIEGDGMLPKVTIKLSEDFQQSTIQKITRQITEITNGSIFDSTNISAGSIDQAAVKAIVSDYTKTRYLSKKEDDTAAGFITFLRGLAAKEEITAEDGIRFGQYMNGFLGSGAYIDNRGRAEFESIFSRSFISTPELRYNRIAVTEGEQWCTNGYGIIESVDTEAKTITLHLEENDYASVAVDDLCRGVYNNFGTSEEYQNTTTLDADNCGFPIKAGFFTSYFRVKEILEQSQGKCVFAYELRNDSTPHPCAQMKFAQYGNVRDEARQASAYMSSTGHFYFQCLEKVSTWEISSVNVTIRFGWVDGFDVKLTGGSYQTLKGYGLYAPDNIYFGNAIVQLDAKTVDSLRKDLQQYTIELSSYTDVITVDDAGNVIGGLYKLNGETKHSFRIAPAVFVRKGNDYLIEADAKDDAGEGTFKMYVTPKNCTVEVINGAVCVTAIDNIKDGVAGTKDDVNFDYNAMRAMESISVIVSVNCEGIGSITKTFSVAIKHDSVPYINFSMSNTNTSVSWNTKSGKYIGLPYSFKVFAHKGSVALPMPSVKLSDVEGAEIGTANTEPNNGYTLVTIGDLSNVTTDTVRATFTASVKYAEVSYESNLVHTINVYQDVNVYDLRPSVTQVVMANASDGSHTPSVNYVTCRVLCNSSEDEPYYLSKDQMKALSASVKFSKSGDDTLYDYNLSPEEGTPEGVAVTDGLTRITFYLYIGGEVYDTQDVSVMYHGKNGDNGKGISSANTYYAIGDNSETEPDDGLFINDTLSALLIHSNQSKSIWSATKVVYTDKTEALTGKYFVGLAEDLVQIIEGYGLSDSPTEEPDGWYGYPTVIPQGKYLWACDLIQWVGEVMTEANVRMIGYIGKETSVYYLVSNMTSISVDDNGHIPISGQTLDITLKKSIGGDTTDSTDYNIMSYTLKADGSRTIMGSEQGNGSPFKIALPESLTDNITGYYFEVVEGDAIIASLSVLYVKNGASAYEITMSNLNLTYNSRKGNIDGNHPVSRLEVNIQCSKGGTPLKYTNGTADDWVCSTLTENVSDPIIDGVLWSFKVSEDGYTFTYVIYCKTTNKVDVEIPFVVTAGGVQRQYKIHLQSYEDGGTPLNRGIWSSEGYIDENGEATNGYFYRYKGDTLIRDLVAYKIGGIYYYYLVKNFTGDTPVTEAPATAVTTEVPVEIVDEETGETTTSVSEEVTYQTSDKWEQMSKVKTIFSEVIYADDATIGGFHANATNLWSGGDTPDTASVSLDGETGEINSRGAEASVRIANGLIEVLNNVGNCNIRFGLKDGYAVLSYYDNNGNLLYDLGPNGIDASTIEASKLEKVIIYSPNGASAFYSYKFLSEADGKWKDMLGDGEEGYGYYVSSNNQIWSGGFGSKPTVGAPSTCYRYTAAKINGVCQADNTYGLTQEQAKLCDGLYFSTNAIHDGDSLANYKATGIIGIENGSSVAGVRMNIGRKYAPIYRITSVSINNGIVKTTAVVSEKTNKYV